MVLLAVGLYIMGYIAIVAEFFIPAGGFVGLAGVGSIIGGIILIYRNYGNGLGLVFLVAALILTPVLMVLYFKYFPGSFIGKRLILFKDQKKEQGFTAHTVSVYEKLEGKEGISLTPLRPAGTVLIDNRRYSVVTSGEFIERSRKIKVLRVEGGRMIVEKLNIGEEK
ncbi:MAG: hypothetical protein GXP33_06955 [Spirochaetes bacterium]|nr:hypothetical protein [Spirochaetota bacterium]